MDEGANEVAKLKKCWKTCGRTNLAKPACDRGRIIECIKRDLRGSRHFEQRIHPASEDIEVAPILIPRLTIVGDGA